MPFLSGFLGAISEGIRAAHRAVHNLGVSQLGHGLEQARGVGHGGCQVSVIGFQMRALDVVGPRKQVLHLLPVPQFVFDHCQACTAEG